MLEILIVIVVVIRNNDPKMNKSHEGLGRVSKTVIQVTYVSYSLILFSTGPLKKTNRKNDALRQPAFLREAPDRACYSPNS